MLLPLYGVSMLDAGGREFWDPAAVRACFDAIGETVRPDVPVNEVDAHINDPAFADRVAEDLLRLLEG